MSDPTKPESHCPPTADDSSAHADHGTDAFEAAIERAADADDTYADFDVTYKMKFKDGARWARAWTLANDPTVRAFVEALKQAQADERERILEDAGNPGLEGCGRVSVQTKYDVALKAWKEKGK